MARLVTTTARNVIQQQPFRRVRSKGRNNSRWFVNELVPDVLDVFPRVTDAMESASIFTTLLQPAKIEIERDVIDVLISFFLFLLLRNYGV